MEYLCPTCGATWTTNIAKCGYGCDGQFGVITADQMESVRKVAICRSNQCGHYDSDRDACVRVIELQAAKGKKRSGSVAFLYGAPSLACVADDPLF